MRSCKAFTRQEISHYIPAHIHSNPLIPPASKGSFPSRQQQERTHVPHSKSTSFGKGTERGKKSKRVPADADNHGFLWHEEGILPGEQARASVSRRSIAKWQRERQRASPKLRGKRTPLLALRGLVYHFSCRKGWFDWISNCDERSRLERFDNNSRNSGPGGYMRLLFIGRNVPGTLIKFSIGNHLRDGETRALFRV